MTNMRYAQKVYSFASPVSSKLHSFVCFLPQFDYSWGRPLDTDRTLCDILDCITASLHHPQQVSCKMPKKWAVGPLSGGGCIPNIFTQVIPGIRKRKLGKTQCGKLPLATHQPTNLIVAGSQEWLIQDAMVGCTALPICKVLIQIQNINTCHGNKYESTKCWFKRYVIDGWQKNTNVNARPTDNLRNPLNFH